jgi:hypothetical protein
VEALHASAESVNQALFKWGLDGEAGLRKPPEIAPIWRPRRWRGACGKTVTLAELSMNALRKLLNDPDNWAVAGFMSHLPDGILFGGEYK